MRIFKLARLLPADFRWFVCFLYSVYQAVRYVPHSTGGGEIVRILQNTVLHSVRDANTFASFADRSLHPLVSTVVSEQYSLGPFRVDSRMHRIRVFSTENKRGKCKCGTATKWSRFCTAKLPLFIVHTNTRVLLSTPSTLTHRHYTRTNEPVDGRTDTRRYGNLFD